MHNHGTAVLTRAAEAEPASMPGASARDVWVAQCESQLAKALATRNVDLLPVIASAVFLPEPLRCPDCLGTGYTSYDTIDLCTCMGRKRPVYDFLRFAKGEAPLNSMGMSSQTPSGQLDVWTPCQHCGILPARIGPYDGDDLLRVPWVPDCPTCNDTGWAFVHHIPAGYQPW